MVAAVLTGQTAAATGQTTASWSVTSDITGGTIYVGVRLASSPVLGDEYLSFPEGPGDGVAFDSDRSVTADGANGGVFSGLSPATEYVVDMVHQDGVGAFGDVVSTASFTTDSVPDPEPSFSPPAVTVPQQRLVT